MILSIQTLYDIQPLLTIRSEGNSQSNCKRTLSDNSRCVMWICHSLFKLQHKYEDKERQALYSDS